MKTVYMGNYHEVFKVLLKKTELTHVIFEENKESSEIIAICEMQKIKYSTIRSALEIERYCCKDSICIVASFGTILNNAIIGKFKKIINIHPGDIFSCRGRHPLPFAILKKMPFMTLTAHTIDSERIDAGRIITTMSIPINYKASYCDNEMRLRMMLEPLTQALVAFIIKNMYYDLPWFDKAKAPYNTKLSPKLLQKIINCSCLEDLICE